MPAATMHPRKILAIDPGTREIGVAVFDGNDPEYYGVKTVTHRSSPSSILAQVREIIRSIIKLLSPNVMAIERPFLGYGSRSSLLVVVAKEMKQLAAKFGLEVIEINPKTAKKLIAGNGGVTKRDVARIVCSRFPEMRIYLGQTH